LIQKNFHKDFHRQHTNRTSAQERGLFFHTIFTNRCDFNNILRQEIVNEYVADRYNLGDDEAKGKRLSDKITNTLGE